MVTRAVRRLFADGTTAPVVVFTIAIGFGAASFGTEALYAGCCAEPRAVNARGLVVLESQDASGRWQSWLREMSDVRPVLDDSAHVAQWAVYKVERPAVTVANQTSDAIVARVSGRFFETVGGGGALRGRGLDGSANEAVVSSAFWARYLGDSASLERPPLLRIGTRSYSVVGVAPASFDFPEATTVWYTAVDSALSSPACCVTVIARLQPGTSTAALSAELAATAGGSRPPTESRMGIRARSFRTLFDANPIRDVFPFGVALIIVIVLVTVVNTVLMLFGRGVARASELAVRSALGASPAWLSLGIGAETSALVALGALGGAALDWLAVRYVSGISATGLPIWFPLRVAWVSLGALGVLSVVTIAAAAWIQAWSCLPRACIAPSSGRLDISKDDQRVSERLVCAQVAMAVAFVCSAAVFAANLMQHLNLTDAMDTRGLYVSSAQRSLREADSLDPRPVLPDGGATFARSTVLMGQSAMRVEGAASAFGSEHLAAAPRIIFAGPNFLRVTGIQLRRGRDLDESAASSAVISAAAADAWFGARDPIGQYVELDSLHVGAAPVRLTVTGVMGDLRDGAWAFPDAPATLITNWRPPARYRPTVYFRVANPSLVQSRARRLAAANPTLDLSAPVALFVQRQREVDTLWVPVDVFGPIAVLTLLLAMTGVASLVRFTALRRQRELAIRSALGSTPTDLVRLVGGRLLAVVLLGELVGCAAAWTLITLSGSRIVFSNVPELMTTFTLTLAGVVVCSFVGAAPVLNTVRGLDPSSFLKDVGR